MTVTDSKGGDPEITLNAVPDPTLATAVGVYEQDAKPDGSGKQDQATGGAPSGPPIPVGHSRFYCNKCRTVSVPPHALPRLEPHTTCLTERRRGDARTATRSTRPRRGSASGATFYRADGRDLAGGNPIDEMGKNDVWLF
ncbi:hypothetical protein THAOC_37286 [Thalassiosira oceanica]|uniref:Uncharacterized protein n=1 Tax=Thalassiosira oceanica TaxID=159749 RepID=K0RCK5_THAOC|nr:hypothetical protein THAOC_37286 [Thalassiosira oceanica]|eukprot:EJK44197.1 hypothetical protein THAOC_37286 [Thalassiosira oceanica]